MTDSHILVLEANITSMPSNNSLTTVMTESIPEASLNLSLSEKGPSIAERWNCFGWKGGLVIRQLTGLYSITFCLPPPSHL